MFWNVERAASIAAAGLASVTMLAGFGGGPLAHATRSNDAVLDFAHVVQQGTFTQLQLDLGPEMADGQPVQVWLDSDFLRTVGFQDVQPTPLGSSKENGRLTFTFPAPAEGANSRVVFEIEYQTAGLHKGEIGVVGGPTLGFEQLAIP